MSDDHALLLQMSYDLARLQKQQNAALGIVDSGMSAMERRAKKGATELESAFDKTAPLKHLEIANQLTVAQTAGNKAQVKALQEELLLLDQVTKYRKLGLSLTEAQALAEKQVAAVAVAEALAVKTERGGNIGLAATRVFDRSRLGLIEEGGAKIGVFGSALEALGPAGLVGAAGVAVAGIAIERAIKAAEWAEELTKTAHALGITTDALQKFDFIAKSTGIGVDAMRESMKGLNQTIGSIEDHSAKARVANLFKELKLDSATLKSYGDLSDILPALLDRIAKLNLSGAILADVAKKLKVSPEVLTSLLEQRHHLEELNKTMAEYGIVIDEDVIQKSAEAAEKMHVASAIMDAELKKSFIELAPTIAAAEIELAKAIKSMADFIQKCGDALRPIMDLVAAIKSIPHMGGVGGAAWEGIQNALNPLRPVAKPIFDWLAAKGKSERELADLKSGINDLLTGTGKFDPANHPTGSLDLSTPKKGKGAGSDPTDALTKTAAEDLAAAQKALAEAYKALTGDIDEAAAFAIKANNAEAQAKQAKLTADREALLKNKKIDGATSDILQAQIEEAQADVEKTRVAKEDLINREAAYKLDQQLLAQQQLMVDMHDRELAARSALATTAKQRSDFEIEIFRDQQAKEAASFELAQNRAASIGEITPQEAAGNIARLKAAQTDELEAERRKQYLAANPLAAYTDQLTKSTGDLDTAFQNMEVHGLQDFENSVVGAIPGLQKLGPAADLVRLALEKFLILPLAQSFSKGGGGFSSLLGNIFSGGSASAGGYANGVPVGSDPIGDLLASLPGFATGTSFTVGGSGGIDQNLIAFRATLGERVTVETPEQQRAGGWGGGDLNQTFVFPGANPDGFRQTRRQWAREAHQAMQIP